MWTSDREIAELSGKFRGVRHATDVLSFPAPLDEIVISLDTARRQARERHVPLHQELTLLATHGLLHLLGFDDETRAGRMIMRKSEFEMLMRML